MQVLFAADETESLKLIGKLDDCVDFLPFNLTITWVSSDMCASPVDGKCTTPVQVTECGGMTDSSGSNATIADIENAFASTELSSDVSISEVGSSVLVISFNESFSYVEMAVSKPNEFGLGTPYNNGTTTNDIQKNPTKRTVMGLFG